MYPLPHAEHSVLIGQFEVVKKIKKYSHA